MRKIKNILLLAGGDSTRFWPFEEKNFFYFLGKPLILHQIEQLSKFAEKIVIVANQKNIINLKRLIENSGYNFFCQIIVQKDIPGQAGAILSVKNLIKGEVLILNASDVFDYSILEKIVDLPYTKNNVVFFGKKVNQYFSGGYFQFDESKKLKAIIEKPAKDNLPSNIVKLVVDYFYDINFLIKTIEVTKSNSDDVYEKALTKILSTDFSCQYFIYDNYWQTIKYPWDVLLMNKLFLSKIKKSEIDKSVVISKKAIINGPVILEKNVKIGDFVKINGPVFIGENTIISDYSLVRESSIGEDCLIGSYSEVARSYIGNKVFLHRNYVGDSVLGDRVMMGAQAVSANLRFDGQTVGSYYNEDKIDTNFSKLGAMIGNDAKIGVNCTILPGVKIGKKTWIAPFEIVRYDIEDNTYLINGEERINSFI